MPPSPRTPYFSIQKLSLASMTKGSELRIFSNGKKLKSARSWPGWLKWSPTPVSKWWVTAALCSVHLFLHGLVAPTFPTYWAGFLWHLPAPFPIPFPYFCGAPLFPQCSPKSAEELFYQWLPQMCAAPLNMFLKESHRKWLFSHPKHEQNWPGKKLWLDKCV